MSFIIECKYHLSIVPAHKCMMQITYRWKDDNLNGWLSGEIKYNIMPEIKIH